MTQALKCKFNPGKIVITPAAMRKTDPEYGMAALVQFLEGKWGIVDAEDAKANDWALANGGRLLGAYPLPNDPGSFWIICEADRSVTTILLPEDY